MFAHPGSVRSSQPCASIVDYLEEMLCSGIESGDVQFAGVCTFRSFAHANIAAYKIAVILTPFRDKLLHLVHNVLLLYDIFLTKPVAAIRMDSAPAAAISRLMRHENPRVGSVHSTAVRRECERLDAEMRMSRYQGQKPPDQTTQRPENGLNHFDVER